MPELINAGGYAAGGFVSSIDRSPPSPPPSRLSGEAVTVNQTFNVQAFDPRSAAAELEARMRQTAQDVYGTNRRVGR